jgi:hypothetical protein
MNGNLDQQHRYTLTTSSIDDNSGREDIEELNPNEFINFTTSMNRTIATFQLSSLLQTVMQHQQLAQQNDMNRLSIRTGGGLRPRN